MLVLGSFMIGWHGEGNKFGFAEGRLKSFSGAGQTKLALQGSPSPTTVSTPPLLRSVKSVGSIWQHSSHRFNLMVKPDHIEERDELIPESAKVILIPALKFGALTG